MTSYIFHFFCTWQCLTLWYSIRCKNVKKNKNSKQVRTIFQNFGVYTLKLTWDWNRFCTWISSVSSRLLPFISSLLTIFTLICKVFISPHLDWFYHWVLTLVYQGLCELVGFHEDILPHNYKKSVLNLFIMTVYQLD